jgi:hypothetical protein
MICPKCGFEQPENPECARCGIIVSRYKGPVLGAAPVPPGPPAGYPPAPARPAGGPPPPPPGYGTPPPPPFGDETVSINAAPSQPPMMNAGGSLYGDPVPALAGGGTIYGGPPPAAVAGTVYGGPAAPSPYGVSRPAPSYRGPDLTMGSLLGESFSVYFANFIPFLLISALVLAPLFAFVAYVSTLSADPAKMLPFLLAAIPIQLVCSQVAAAGMAYGVYQHLRGGSPSVSDCLRIGLSSFLPVLGLAIVHSLGIMAGLILCLAPGILLAIRWAVAIPVMVEEKPGILEALQRSSHLTDGYRGTVFGVLFVMGLIQNLSNKALELSIDDLGTYLMATSVVDLFTTGLASTAAAVMYYRLRSAKESIDVDQISSVFD